MRTRHRDPAEIDHALDRLNDIHRQLARGSVFRGYRAKTVALTGFLALGAASVQHFACPAQGIADYLVFWLGIATAAFTLCAGDILHYVLHSQREGLRRETRAAVAQFLPALGAGALMTAALFQGSHAGLLPGLWSINFGLALLASRSFLPRATIAIAVAFMGAGASFLQVIPEGATPSPWFMGLVFGVGNIVLAFFLRLENHDEEAGHGTR
ncbi:MAG: hypothetical protein V3W41_22850 [Planctomycetota bacterium]